MSEELKYTVTNNLSEECSRTDCRILVPISKLDDFLNPKVRVKSRTVPETLPNINADNQETIEDISQNDLRPEVNGFVCRSAHSIESDPGETLYISSLGRLNNTLENCLLFVIFRPETFVFYLSFMGSVFWSFLGNFVGRNDSATELRWKVMDFWFKGVSPSVYGVILRYTRLL